MAHYDAKYSCGHEERIELFGKTSKRESYLEWLTTQKCPKCRRKERDERLAAENAKNAGWREQHHVEEIMPDLDGTPKQVKWANDLRDGVINRTSHDLRERFQPRMLSIIAERTSAAWWIENRGEAFDALAHVMFDRLVAEKKAGMSNELD